MINRKEWTTRHNPVMTELNPESPLTVGNGEFAYSVDVTGLQTLYNAYKEETPLCTMAQWGWHTIPADNASGTYTLSDVKMNQYDYQGREVTYARTKFPGNEKVYDWLRQNPHKFNLARIGLRFKNQEIVQEDIRNVHQELHLYDGFIESNYLLFGTPCHVKTFCHSESDSIAIEITSSLLKDGLTVDLDFPYGATDITGSDWEEALKHETTLDGNKITCEMDGQKYYVMVGPEVKNGNQNKDNQEEDSQGKRISQIGKHRVRIQSEMDTLKLIITFSKEEIFDKTDCIQQAKGTSFSIIESQTNHYWNQFWDEGGAVDFQGTKDPRGMELERRIVLSLYLLAVNCAGSMPPQETGLTCNSWYGKAHLEMYFWHMAWAPLWNHGELLMRSIPWYENHIQQARDNAARNGYKGARWPKMVGDDALDSPSKIAVLLVWQQPHIIMMLELIRRSMYANVDNSKESNERCGKENTEMEFIKRYWGLMEETVTFMVDYVVADEDGIYHIVPPVIPVQERHLPENTLDPAFEVAYWKYTLGIAIDWGMKLLRNDTECADGEKIESIDEDTLEIWKHVYWHMTEPPVADGAYIAQKNCPETFSEKMIDHPLMLQNYGMLPGEDIDKEIMEHTLDEVIHNWDYHTLWGWDFAVIAMTATRLHKPEIAIDQLMCDTDKNCYVASGNNRQISRTDLPLYLPGNGSLLLATAMMTAGYDGEGRFPGYPRDGSWNIKCENVNPYI